MTPVAGVRHAGALQMQAGQTRGVAGRSSSPAPCVPADIAALPVERRIVHFASGGDARNLLAALEECPTSAAICEVHDDLDGTIHYHVIDRAVLMANSNFDVAEDFVECARLLRSRSAPISPRLNPQGLAMSFLDTDWSTSPTAPALAGLLRDAIEAGDVAVDQRITNHATIAGLLPVTAAIKVGNLSAVHVLFDVGARLQDIRDDIAPQDILTFARAVGRPNSGAIAALLASKLMQDELATAGAVHHAGAAPRARRRLRTV